MGYGLNSPGLIHGSTNPSPLHSIETNSATHTASFPVGTGGLSWGIGKVSGA
jgi:hypothetical protein